MRRQKTDRRGAPIVIVQPSQVYGPNDHSATSAQIERAYTGKLGFAALTNAGPAWVHVNDLAAGIVAALDHGRIGESYASPEIRTPLGGCDHDRRSSWAGDKPPRVTIPTGATEGSWRHSTIVSADCPVCRRTCARRSGQATA